MAMNRWDPFRDLVSIQNELGRLFDRTYGGRGEGGSDWIPPLDVFETEDGYVIHVELAGMAPDDVDISVEERMLSIEGERQLAEDVSEESFRRIERRYGRFSRSLQLPASADPSGIEASFDAGILTIRVPRAEEAQPKRITVRAKA
jgi:HSP20 family protein